MIKRLTLYTVLYFVPMFSLLADDAYHTYIRSQLSEQFGVTGGEWLLPDTEAQTYATLTSDNLFISDKPSTGVETFNNVLEISASARRINSWDAIVRFPTIAAMEKSDVLLLIFWINNTDSLNRRHEVVFDFEMTDFPNDRPLYLSHSIRPGWQQWMLPIQVNHDVAAGEARFQIHLGHMQGHFQLAGVAMLNFGDQYKPDELPESTFHYEYNGQEEDASWRQIALDRIEQIRTSPLHIKIVNRYAEPIEGARVSVELQQHEFGFGSAMSSDMFFNDTHDARLYRQKLENLTGDGRSFNIITLKNALKWPAWEDEVAWGTRDQACEIIQWFTDRGVRVRGHNLLWPAWQKMPDDVRARAYDQTYLKTRIQNHIVDQVTYPGLKHHIAEWDVINELQQHDDLGYALGSSDIYMDCFQWANAADPTASLYLNENDIIDDAASNGSFDDLISLLQNFTNGNTPIHGLGMQGHMTKNLTPPEQLLTTFDHFSQFDLDLSITEYDAVGVDERIAADYMRDILIAAFSHPNMRNFVMWGFWDGAHWKKDSPIFHHNWSLKPSGRVFLEYVFDKWWTRDHGTTDQFGDFYGRGFYGDYNISISLHDQVTQKSIKLSREHNQFTIQMDTDQTTINFPDSFQLFQNAPNPFNSLTEMIYELPTDMPVRINLYDVRGRYVKTLLNQQHTAGRHILRIDGSTLSSGIYYVYLQSGKLKRVRKILSMK